MLSNSNFIYNKGVQRIKSNKYDCELFLTYYILCWNRSPSNFLQLTNIKLLLKIIEFWIYQFSFLISVCWAIKLKFVIWISP